MNTRHVRKVIAGAMLASLALSTANAQLNFSSLTTGSSGTYSQDFNTLGSLATQLWTDNTTLPGWYAARQGNGTSALLGPIPTYIGGSGAGNTGGLYSFTNNSVSPAVNKALGSISSGTPNTMAYGVCFTNDTTTKIITNITINYTGEQWRNGGNTAVQTLAFSYYKASGIVTNADPTSTLVWTAVSSLNFDTPIVGATAAALDGHAAANRTVIAPVALTGLQIGPGEGVFFRWVDINDAGNDHGVALDDLSISWSTVAAGVNTGPSISAQPVNTTNYAGNNIQFAVTAAGTTPLSYQWYYTNSGTTTLIDGATGAGLSLNIITNQNAGQYFVVVTNAYSPFAVTSSVVNLTVLGPVVTNISYLHTLQDANYALTNTTTLFQISGTVTTTNLVSGGVVYSFYIQDATGGIDVFERGGFAANDPINGVDIPAVGQRVTVTATLGQFNGAIEVSPVAANPADNVVFSNGDQTIYPLPAPKVLDFASLTDFAKMETNYEGSLVVVSNVFLDQTLVNFTTAAATTLLMTNSLNQTMQLFNSVPASSSQGQPIPAFAYSVTGVVIQNKSSSPFTGNYQVALNLYSDIVTTPPASAPVLNLQASGSSLTMTWNGSYNLQSATNVAGPYTTISGAVSGFSTNAALSIVPAQFFRLSN